MKKAYNSPEFDIKFIDTMDCITVSGASDAENEQIVSVDW